MPAVLNSKSKTSDGKYVEEIIEVEVDDSYYHSEEIQRRTPIVHKLLIIGLKSANAYKGGKAIILSMYPEKVGKKPELDYHNLIFACFPDRIKPEAFSVEENKYCTFLRFKELVLKDGELPLIVPKSICVISNEPLYESQKQFLQMVFKNVIFKNNICSITALYDDPMNYLLSVAMTVQCEIKENLPQYLSSQLEYYISMYFHYLQMSPDVINFELQADGNQ